MSALSDIVTIIEYLCAQKTLPPRQQAALDRVRLATTEPSPPPLSTVVTGKEQSRE